MYRCRSLGQDNLVKFKNLIGDIGSHIKKEFVARKTQRAVDRYRNSGEVKFPRIYAYRQTPNGVEVVPDEAKVVRIVLGLLVMGKTPDEIKRDLDKRGIRNRSANRFTTDEIKAIPKPVYAGMILAKSGKLVQSNQYEALVSIEILKKAQRAVKKVSEGADYRPPAIGERVFLTSAGSGQSPNNRLGFWGSF